MGRGGCVDDGLGRSSRHQHNEHSASLSSSRELVWTPRLHRTLPRPCGGSVTPSVASRLPPPSVRSRQSASDLGPGSVRWWGCALMGAQSGARRLSGAAGLWPNPSEPRSKLRHSPRLSLLPQDRQGGRVLSGCLSVHGVWCLRISGVGSPPPALCSRVERSERVLRSKRYRMGTYTPLRHPCCTSSLYLQQ